MLNDEKPRVLDGLSAEQRLACETKENCILIACPGSGKTRTIVHRLAYLGLSYPLNKKKHIAITYTNRASEEMESRLQDMGIEDGSIWTGTIHQFCMEYIIRPYAMYCDRLRYGFHIIDEYQTEEYVRVIKEQFGIADPYYQWRQDSRIVNEYKKLLSQNKEIDFDDILSESLSILKSHQFVSENIAKIIFSIHIDEYQDTNEKQYQIIAEIFKANNKILLMFVGDVNQAIYRNLGGVAKSIDEIRALFNTDFCEMVLTGCYRSTQRLIDFYSFFAVRRLAVVSKAKEKDSPGILKYSCEISTINLGKEIAAIVNQELTAGVPEKEICIVAPQWPLLYKISKILRKELPSVNFDAPDISPFKYDPINPFYLVARLLFSTVKHNGRIRKKRASEILHILQSDYGASVPSEYDALSLLETINRGSHYRRDDDGIEIYKKTIELIFKELKIGKDDYEVLYEKYDAFIKKAEDRIRRYSLAKKCCDFESCFMERQGVVVTSLHSVKGEEYHSVIAFGLLNGILPHWDYIRNTNNQSKYRHDDTYRLLYVLFSRAKENLYLISEMGRYTGGGRLYTPTDELKNCRVSYDRW